MRATEHQRGGGLRVASSLLLLVTLCATMVLAAPPADAIETDTFRLEPSPAVVHGFERRAFAVDPAPGEQLSDAVAVENLTDEPRTFRLFAADASVEPGTGAISIASSRAEPSGVGSWVTLERADLTVAPDQRETVAFTIRRPEGAPAEGAGAIVAEEVLEDPTTGGISVVYRLALLIRVGGDVAGLRVGEPTMDRPLEFFPSGSEVRVELTNETLQPIRATVAASAGGVTGRFWELGEEQVSLATGESTQVSLAWGTVPRWGGLFRPTVDVAWDGGTIQRTGTRYLHPPLWLLALAIAVVGARAVRELQGR